MKSSKDSISDQIEQSKKPDTQIKKHPYTQNRELSWLKFNERVLEEAEDTSVPLLERLKFISIFTSNLDEFFMIRVGSLFDISLMDGTQIDQRSGMTPKQQLDAIYSAVRPLYERRDAVYSKVIKGLKQHDVSSLGFSDLAPPEVAFIKEYFESQIKPLLSPQIVDTHHPFPHIPNKSPYIIATLSLKNETTLGLLPVPSALPEVVFLPSSDVRYINTAKIILHFAEKAFGKYHITEKTSICITRNADINPDDEIYEVTADFRAVMQTLLRKRKKLAAVRLEMSNKLSDNFLALLCQRFELAKHQIFIAKAPVRLSYVFGLGDRLSPAQQKQLTYPEFSPQPMTHLTENQSMIKNVRHGDIMLHFPYESINPFTQLIAEAATNPDVISIKITIYRLANKAKIVDCLCRAADNGKDVTVLMELRARFDEQNNINWSERLEDAGCKIIYGFDQYKVHSKICLITLKDKNGVNFITQVGTGNYNEKTAAMYTDLSLMTANQSIGEDASEFFKNMSIGNVDGQYNHLIVSPTSLKAGVINAINEEIEKGSDGFIFLKINSLTDVDLINLLAKASKSGVRVQIIVRGICCLLPNIAGETFNIHIMSIVGRFLEHSRVYMFGKDDDRKIYIASADWMTRNTERRVEVACPILDKKMQRYIIEILETAWYDNVKSRILTSSGDYIKKIDNHSPINSQEVFIEQAKQRATSAPKVEKSFFEKLKTKLFPKKYK